MNSNWLQLSLKTTEHDPELLEEALLAAGALAVTLQDGGDQPLLEPAPGTTPLWSDTVVTGLFDQQSDIASIRQQLCAQLGDAVLAACRLENLEDRDWVRVWLDDFKPMCFGQQLWVVPSHYEPPQADAVNVILDPGLAFGTGTHPTTALCLQWLDSAVLSRKRVVDYGCGSGILAIAAAKLGAERVHAVDIDPQALLACQENAANNHVVVSVALPEDFNVQHCDIILANILAAPLRQLAAKFARLLQPGGHLIMAGLLAEQADDVQTAYAEWFNFASPVHYPTESWVLLTAQRNTQP